MRDDKMAEEQLQKEVGRALLNIAREMLDRLSDGQTLVLVTSTEPPLRLGAPQQTLRWLEWRKPVR